MKQINQIAKIIHSLIETKYKSTVLINATLVDVMTKTNLASLQNSISNNEDEVNLTNIVIMTWLSMKKQYNVTMEMADCSDLINGDNIYDKDYIKISELTGYGKAIVEIVYLLTLYNTEIVIE